MFNLSLIESNLWAEVVLCKTVGRNTNIIITRLLTRAMHGSS